MPLLSVIIPTLNEARILESTLRAVAASPTPHELIVVDGGSSDGTLDLAQKFGAKVLKTDCHHRGRQMNMGRAQAVGEWLLFLHADTILAPAALPALVWTLQSHEVVGGGFARRYDSSSRFLRLTCHLADWRGRCCGWFLGDQAIFVRSPVFDALGGFRDMTLFEDLDFSRRMKTQGRLALVHPPVRSSARRFSARGPLLTTLSDLGLTLGHLIGLPKASRRGKASLTQKPRLSRELP